MYMKRILALFIVLLLTSGTVFCQKKEAYRVRTVVIDPGHGGAKPGAQGKQTQEKTITLAVAKKFGKLIEDNYPGVKVIYTRTTDVDISLAERAHIANRNKADLFISIHANSHPTSTPTGVETFVMGLSESKANLEVAKKENADILLEADYKNNADYGGFDPNAPETYVMLAMFQNAFIDKSLNLAQAIQTQYKHNLKTINRGVKQAELYVLYKTTCPSVLTEIGFISNPTEEAFMISEEGQAKIAICLFNAFMTYKATEEGTNKIANPVYNIKGYTPQGSKEEQAKPTPAKEPEIAAVEEKAQEPVKQQEPATQAPTEKKAEPATPEKKVAPTTAKTDPIEKPKEKPLVDEVEAKPKQVVTPAEKPLPQVTLPAVQEEKKEKKEAPKEVPQPAPAPQGLEAPKHTAQPDAPMYYTVQFMLHPVLFKPGDAALGGITDFQTFQRDNNYVYSTGRFLTAKEAGAYCDHVRAHTPFKDAWVTRYKTPAKQTTQDKQPVADKAQPAKNKQTEAKPANNTDRHSVRYRVQFCTSNKRMKAGDPDLQGISDFRIATSGNWLIYTAGDYDTRAAAQQRLNKIRASTNFKDAFVVAIYKGERISMERAAQIEKKGK